VYLQEKSVKSVLCSALDECLTVGSNNHHQWNRQLLEELIDRCMIVKGKAAECFNPQIFYMLLFVQGINGRSSVVSGVAAVYIWSGERDDRGRQSHFAPRHHQVGNNLLGISLRS
jgi:hypothetical protein